MKSAKEMWNNEGKHFNNNWAIDIRLHNFINKQVEELGWK